MDVENTGIDLGKETIPLPGWFRSSRSLKS